MNFVMFYSQQQSSCGRFVILSFKNYFMYNLTHVTFNILTSFHSENIYSINRQNPNRLYMKRICGMIANGTSLNKRPEMTY